MKPSPYPSNTKEELDAIIFFERMIDRRFVIPHVTRHDKIPNTDGHIDILDDKKYPVGKLEVQIRKIPRGATSYSCPVELIAYSQAISLPFLLICVDVENEKAYFRHLHSQMPEFKSDQKTFTINFDQTVNVISQESRYVDQWLSLIEEYNKRISDYARLDQIVNELDPAHISKPDKIYFQEFVEQLNHLLDYDFRIIKDRYFKGVWKFGVAVSSANSQELCFQLYTIAPGGPDIRVTGIASHPEKPAEIPNEAVSSWQQGKPGTNTVQYNWIYRANLKPAKSQAEEFIFKQLEKMLRQKTCSVFGKNLTAEYLFWFVDNFSNSIGVEPGNCLNTADLNYGISVYFPAWASLAVPRYTGELVKLNRHNIKAAAYAIAFPMFETVARWWPTTSLPGKEEVLNLIKSGNALIPARVCFYDVSPQTLAESVDYLLAENVASIERPYKQRSSASKFIWSGYTVAELRYNIKKILVDLLDDYRLFIRGNNFQFKKSIYLDTSEAIIYHANLDEWSKMNDRFNSPILKSYMVENGDGKLPKFTFIDSSEFPGALVAETERVKINGLERQLLGTGEEVASDLFKDLPTLIRIYDMLKRDIANEYGHTIP